ncbi:transcriptional regulator family: Fungal Specific TF [Penicillium roqueforti]|nr:transcriptional regulator family: Fungal Specific TF [Penicillium roqueforti]KAI2750700.1 transcriptional regulator family: Fungal Specific TF [Penicillium roqueforti]KAI2767610.1 transcriptional regulator family: Fungal Specific TF [Penicillium roqueforti]KAI3071156.1 transcriptional regulator family: Fungal Specific TF [Penicillium roqueforti]KAI3101181.1 transcriptional regulator family: Fungal Specific TF [Penicillium roqueforti]
MTGTHDSGAETGTEHSPSRFTAVNGRETVAPVNANGNENGNGNGNGNGPPPSSVPNGERAPTQEKTTSDPSHRDDRDDPANDQEKWSQRSSPSGSHNKNKRKRSESRGRDSVNASRSPVTRPAESNQTNPNGSVPGSTSEMERGNHSATPSHRSEGNDAGQTSANSPWSEYDSQLITQAQRAQQMDASDAHLADALQRETGQERSMTNRSTPGAQLPSSPSYAPDRHGAMQVAPKRKRVFSNRTKTGCMTCRRRKKKCDEQHPACNNCLRGGFLCEGYSSRSTWQKPSSTKTPIPLQSKEGYSDINGLYMQEVPRQQERQPNLVEHVDATKIRPLVVEDNDRPVQQYNTSPTHTPSNHAWSKQAWPGAGPGSGSNAGLPAYPSESIAKVVDYREVPPIHELSREGRPKPDYPVMSSLRDLSHPSHPKSNMPLFQNEQRTLPAATVDTHSPQAQARMALSIEHQLSGRTVPSDETEKEKMINGKLYRPFDVHLVEERDRCRGALWKFNNACNPLTGVSVKEQNRLLKEIIVPPASSIVNPPAGSNAPRSAGSIGQGAVVEAPFSCHYGYNIHIGEDVMISENCLFVDDCVIRIGAHTWIGPNVKIISSTAHPNMQERKGSQSRYQGRQVIIEEDCYVGAGCIIYPGVRLARGVYVAPGEIVNTNIAGYMFQGSKPSFAM